MPCAEKASCSNALQSFSAEGASETPGISFRGLWFTKDSFHPLDGVKPHCSSSAWLQEGSPDTCVTHLSPTQSSGQLRGCLCCFPKGLCPLCGVVNPELSCWAVPKLRLQLTEPVSERGLPGIMLGGLCYWESQQWAGDKGVTLFSCYEMMLILLYSLTSTY